MTISNETKVGSLTALAIVLLILGFNFLKGKSLTASNTRYYATFSNVQGLAQSNPVVINGVNVGNISKIDGGEDYRQLIVTINMTEKVRIPADAVAQVNRDLLGTVQLEIKLGNAKTYLQAGDTIKSKVSGDFLGDAMKKLDPVLYSVNKAVLSLDSLVGNLNEVLDPASKQNLKGMLDNLNKTTAGLAASSASLNVLLNTQTGTLAKTLDNVSAFTGNLKDNNAKLTQTMTNVASITDKFAKMDLQQTITSLNGTVSELKGAIGKINGKDGTLGLLLNDTKLYYNLNATSNKLNLLLDDLRLHPKRYVNVSVFGRKDKTGPLTVPLPDTVNAPYTQHP